MNLSTQTVKTMSSREIAELLGKRHAHVMRDIRIMLEQLSDNPDSGYQQNQVLTDICPQTKRIACYHLPRRECEILVTGYDVVRRTKVIDRWLELEAKQVQALPQDYLSALKCLVEAEEVKEVQRIALAEAQPKVEYYDQLVDSEGLLTPTQIGSKYGISAQRLAKVLSCFDVYDGRSRKKRFVISFIQNGYGVMKTTGYGDQPYFTIKGESWVKDKLTALGYTPC